MPPDLKAGKPSINIITKPFIPTILEVTEKALLCQLSSY
jgi:hypothetical protein